jgi:hypothetical protein
VRVEKVASSLNQNGRNVRKNNQDKSVKKPQTRMCHAWLVRSSTAINVQQSADSMEERVYGALSLIQRPLPRSAFRLPQNNAYPSTEDTKEAWECIRHHWIFRSSRRWNNDQPVGHSTAHLVDPLVFFCHGSRPTYLRLGQDGYHHFSKILQSAPQRRLPCEIPHDTVFTVSFLDTILQMLMPHPSSLQAGAAIVGVVVLAFLHRFVWVPYRLPYENFPGKRR